MNASLCKTTGRSLLKSELKITIFIHPLKSHTINLLESTLQLINFDSKALKIEGQVKLLFDRTDKMSRQYGHDRVDKFN